MKKISTILTLLVFTSIFSQVPSYVPTDGLVGYWPFNGNANDVSGNGNNGTVTGATLTTDRFGNADSAYGFTTNSDKILNQNFNMVSQNFTISVWCKVSTTFTYTTFNIVEFGPIDNSTVGGISLRMDQNNNFYGNNMYKLYGLANNNYVLSQPFDFNLINQWNNFIFTKDDGITKLYLNGQLLNSNLYSEAINYANSILQFGNKGNINDNLIGNRLLDEIGIWNRALTQEEITNLYRADNTFFNFCMGAKVSDLVAATGKNVKVYTTANGTEALGDVALKGTAAAPSAYFLTEPTDTGESARVPVYVIINALPATPTALVLTNENAVLPAISTKAITAVGVYTGTNTPLKLSVTAKGAVSYKWTLPSGVERTNAAGTTTDPSTTSTEPYIYVKFTGTGAASPIVINVQSVNASGCTSLAKTSASLTRLLPAAPVTLAVNNGINTTAIKSFATYMGTPTVLRLSATPTPTASSYYWELPAGVNRVTALEGGINTTDLTSTDPFIYVNFSGVSKENTDTNTTVVVLTKVLRLGVKAVNGVGLSTTINSGLQSSAKLLTLTAVAPAAPASLKMTEAGSTTAVTNITAYLGKTTTLTLTAASSILATSYEWELPAGVTKISGGSSNVITVNFANVPAGTTSLYLGVKAVNAIGSSVKVNAATLVPSTNSTATLLKVTATAPAAVGTINGTLAICSTKSSSVTYTIPATAKYATLYNITAPAGCTITNSFDNRATIAAVAGATFTVNYPSGFIANKTTVKTISIQSENGFGVNTAANKVLVLTNAGAVCTPSNVSSRMAPKVSTANFNVIAYPNPSSEVFTIDITSPIKEADIHVYDMAGRLIEKHQINSNSLQVGKNYAPGIYNIMVSQGSNLKTIQIIKK